MKTTSNIIVIIGALLLATLLAPQASAEKSESGASGRDAEKSEGTAKPARYPHYNPVGGVHRASAAESGDESAPGRKVEKREDAKPAGLLLPAVQKVREAPARTKPRMSLQRMMRELKPTRVPAAAAASAAGSAGANTQLSVGAKPPEPPKYEVTDCTGSDGVSKACCAWQPGDGGSTCDLFIALCNSHDGWSGNGNSNGAVCTGEGTVE
jgi:hypothetical protein